MIEFSIEYNVEVRVAYYPPYHSKYNPIERVWGFLESHWNGDLIDYKKLPPEVTLIKEVYKTGKTLDKAIMLKYESALVRMVGLKKYFVTIDPSKCIEKLALIELYG